MDREWSEWVEDEGETAPKRHRRGKREPDVAIDVEEDELAEWKQERGSRGRKPIDERRRRSRRGEDDEEI